MEDNSQDPHLYVPCATLERKGTTVLGEYYLLSAPIGLRPDSYDCARRFLVNLASHLVVQRDCTLESYVALHQARARETIELFADHAPSWLPETILGVWTHLPAPRMMTSEALMEMDSRSSTGMRMHTLFRVTTGTDACLDSMATMAGTGTGVQILSQIDAERLLYDLKDIFLNFIKERLFRVFPWYVPLLTMQSLEEPIATLTEQAFTHITLYIRESPEDGGILILSREHLEEALLRIGCQPVDLTHGVMRWKLRE